MGRSLSWGRIPGGQTKGGIRFMGMFVRPGSDDATAHSESRKRTHENLELEYLTGVPRRSGSEPSTKQRKA